MKNIILVNYGGPEKDYQVKDFLFRLFSDRNVVMVPGSRGFQRKLAWLISRLRAGKVKKNYRLIGGSPLNEITRSLVSELNREGKDRYQMGMTYSPPFITEVLEGVSESEVYFFPLFPHFSLTTTGACLAQVPGNVGNAFYIKEYWQDPEFNKLVVKKIKKALNKTGPDEKTAVLLSAHSIPLVYEERGDPYLDSIRKHYTVLSKELAGCQLFLGFQSKLGPVKWAKPEVKEVVEEIKERNFSHLIIYPLSFVIDNYETVFELDYELKKDVETGNGLSFSRISCLNTDQDFVKFIIKKADEGPWLKLE